jgi:hypothetical protein
MNRAVLALPLALVLLALAPAPGAADVDPPRGSEAARFLEPAPAGAPATGRVVNRDKMDHRLILTCGAQRFEAPVAAGETVLLAQPVAVGCILTVDQPGAGYEVRSPALDLRIDGGAVVDTLRALTWTPVVATFGHTGPWPDDAVRQWARSADASSEYSPDGWSAKQATGAPDTPGCGDIRTAWATRDARSDKPEWLELRYAQKVRAIGARILVTNAPGAVREVQAHTGSGWETVWKGSDPTDTCPAVLGVRFQEEVDTDGLRILLDTSRQTTWFEVDAVELIGKAP